MIKLMNKVKALIVGIWRVFFGLLGGALGLLGRLDFLRPGVTYLRNPELSVFAKCVGVIKFFFYVVISAPIWLARWIRQALIQLWAYLQRDDLSWEEKIEGMVEARRRYFSKQLHAFQSSSLGSAAVAAFRRAPLIWSITYAMIVFLLWSLIFPLDVASYAQGQVVPAGQLKKIQHLEGGIVREITVVEGQRIDKDAVIAELEDVSPDADAGDMRSRSASYEARFFRITALLENKHTLVIPPEFSAAFPEYAKDALSAFEANRQRYEAMVQTHESKVSQRRAEIQEAKARLVGLSSRSSFIKNQVRISEEMLRQKLTNEYEHLQLLKEQAQIDSDRNSTIATQRRAEVALEESIAEFSAFRHEDEGTLRKELQEVSTELSSLKERLRKPNDSQERTTVKAPVSGTIMTLYVKNTGAVVAPGGVIATLVPDGESLLIEAKLPIGEVGYVNLGAPARLSITTGGNGFSAIAAKVVHVSPDAMADEKTGTSYYVVRLAPEELYFHRGEDKYPLRPGVQVTAAIITGHRSVMALLLEPFIGTAVHPLSER